MAIDNEFEGTELFKTNKDQEQQSDDTSQPFINDTRTQSIQPIDPIVLLLLLLVNIFSEKVNVTWIPI